MSDPRAENHNRMAGELVRSLITSVDASGGNEKDICLLLESVCTGVLLAVTRRGGEKPIMDAIASQAVKRTVETRLKLHSAPRVSQ